jgi:hypothetical protein
VAAGGLSRGRVFLLLAEVDDIGATAVARLLASRHGGGSVAVLSGTQVVFAPGLTLSGGGGGPASALAHARRVAGAEPAAVLCRVYGAPAPWAAGGTPGDAAYAADEAAALLLAWLAALPCPIVNRASFPGLPGPSITRGNWLGLAARAGLPCQGLRMTTNAREHPVGAWPARRPDGRAYGTSAVHPGPRPAHMVEPVSGPGTDALVAGGRVYGPLEPHLHEGARELARTAGCRLMGLRLARGPLGPLVTEADPTPPLTAAGHAEAAADLMERLAAGESA